MNILTGGEIYTAYIEAANQTLRPQDERIALAFARAIEAAVLSKLTAGVSVEPVSYEFQWTNPANSTDQPASMFVWAEVVPQWNGTMQQAVDNLLAYQVNGVPCYRVRMLYTADAIAAARAQALGDAASLIESTELSGLNNDIQLQVFVGKLLIEYCKAIRALIGAKHGL